MNEDLRIAVAEAIGTGVLVIGGCGTAIYATGWNGGASVGIAGVATAFGLSLLIMAYTIGPISGCHINPAVTVGMWMAGKVEARRVPYYVVGQLAGGLIAGGLMRVVWRFSSMGIGEGFASNGYGEHSPNGFSLGSVIVVEIGMTALLLLAVLGTTHEKFPAGFGGLVAGATLWLIHLISIPIDNTSVNPARSLAVAPWAAESWPIEQVWVFLVFPLIGGVVGALLWKLISTPSDAGWPEPLDADDAGDVVVG